jgi:hypothetical protein
VPSRERSSARTAAARTKNVSTVRGARSAIESRTNPTIHSTRTAASATGAGRRDLWRPNLTAKSWTSFTGTFGSFFVRNPPPSFFFFTRTPGSPRITASAVAARPAPFLAVPRRTWLSNAPHSMIWAPTYRHSVRLPGNLRRNRRSLRSTMLVLADGQGLLPQEFFDQSPSHFTTGSLL